MTAGLNPAVGAHVMLISLAATIVGGIGSLRGAVIGGYALGIIENLGSWKIDTEWQSTIAFVVLFLVLLLKPRGLFGRGLR